MKKIVSISLGSPDYDYEFEPELLGQQYHVRRIGTGGDVRLAKKLVREHDGQVDAIGLAGMSIVFQVADRTYYHRDSLKIAHAARYTPVVGGRGLKRILDRWAVRDLANRERGIFNRKNVLFLSGVANWDIYLVMREFTDNISFCDPILHFGVPTVIDSEKGFRRYARTSMPLLTRRPYVSFFPQGRTGEEIQHLLLSKPFEKADVIVGDLSLVLHLAPQDLRGKTVVTDTIDEQRLGALRDRGVSVICTTTPEVFPGHRADLNVLQAIFIAHIGKKPDEIGDDDYLDMIRRLEARPRVIYAQGRQVRRRKFAYLYCPDTQRDLLRHPRLRWMRGLPPRAKGAVERAASLAPPVYYGTVHGIQSPTGQEAEGVILLLPTTAAELNEQPVDVVEKRVRQAVELAKELGAEILGLGTFTGNIGEAGRRIASKETIPITSGHSMTVSATLWAARQACISMGMPFYGSVLIDAKCLVFGAESPAGAVVAELGSLAFRNMTLIGEQPDRLLEFTRDLETRYPEVEYDVGISARDHLTDADIVITGVNPEWRRPFDISVLKPGAVVCDCARPATFTRADVSARPDVLFIGSGELELPGPVDLGVDLGLPPKVAYACMVEPALLALEERFECFTLGFEVDFERVREIYKLALTHGVKLAAIRGPSGVVTDTEIALVRERAERARRAVESPPIELSSTVEAVMPQALGDTLK